MREPSGPEHTNTTNTHRAHKTNLRQDDSWGVFDELPGELLILGFDR